MPLLVRMPSLNVICWMLTINVAPGKPLNFTNVCMGGGGEGQVCSPHHAKVWLCIAISSLAFKVSPLILGTFSRCKMLSPPLLMDVH